MRPVETVRAQEDVRALEPLGFLLRVGVAADARLERDLAAGLYLAQAHLRIGEQPARFVEPGRRREAVVERRVVVGFGFERDFRTGLPRCVRQRNRNDARAAEQQVAAHAARASTRCHLAILPLRSVRALVPDD
jgi:hypothetical protein